MKTIRSFTTTGIAVAFVASTLLAEEPFLRISELRIDEPGPDVNEFFELEGTRGLPLDDVWYLVIGDHSNFGSGATEMPNYRSGVVEFAIDLTGLSIGESGFFTVATTSMNISPRVIDLELPTGALIFENSDNLTHVLVRGYQGPEVLDPSDQLGEKAVNLDPNNDGNLVDPLPWDETIDAIGLIKIPNALVDPETSQEEFYYGAALGFTDIGPDRTFVPGHVYRGANDGEWNIGSFTLSGLDTPGLPNPDSPTEPIISRFSPKTAVRGEAITLSGRNFASVESVMIGAESAAFEILGNNELRITIPEFAVTGPLSIVNASGTLVTQTTLRVLSDNVEVLAYQDFATDFGAFDAISLASDRNWTWGITSEGAGYAEMNGFGAFVDGPSNDWLISPAIDLAGVNEPVLEYVTARNHGGPDLQVLVSTNFTGFNPSLADWTPAGGELSSAGFVLTDSGAVSLDAYAEQTVRIAFRYVSDGTGSGEAATIQVHEFLVRAAGADGFQPGWIDDPVLGEIYLLSNTWAYSDLMGYFHNRYAGWVFLPAYGWFAVVAGDIEDGLWMYSNTFGWIWTRAALQGSFLFLDGTLGEFQPE